MKSFTKWLLSAVLSLLVVGLLWSIVIDVSAKNQQTARQATAKALKDAAQAADAAAGLQLQVATLTNSRDSAIVAALAHKQRAAKLVTVYDTLRLVAPDTCKTIVLTADSALAEKDSVIAADSAALRSALVAQTVLQASVDTLVPALAKLRTGATALVKADAKLAWRQLVLRFLPSPGVGFAPVGIDASGKVHGPQLVAYVGWKL
jgi:hypothetical protein